MLSINTCPLIIPFTFLLILALQEVKDSRFLPSPVMLLCLTPLLLLLPPLPWKLQLSGNWDRNGIWLPMLPLPTPTHTVGKKLHPSFTCETIDFVPDVNVKWLLQVPTKDTVDLLFQWCTFDSREAPNMSVPGKNASNLGMLPASGVAERTLLLASLVSQSETPHETGTPNVHEMKIDLSISY